LLPWYAAKNGAGTAGEEEELVEGRGEEEENTLDEGLISSFTPSSDPTDGTFVKNAQHLSIARTASTREGGEGEEEGRVICS
jgi:hypothetical protein